MHSAVSPEE